ncbi:ketopantoate reductase PanE/ApbA-domain-containing protein [Globomyces pollinis-pini]|nr:ketopantoate reductase PanE/ApbA-domain-containing protein [Globomyces pollinis-pini]
MDAIHLCVWYYKRAFENLQTGYIFYQSWIKIMMNESQEIDILIIGCGGVGGIIASRLNLSTKTRVSIVCGSNYKVIHDNGLFLKTESWGTYQCIPYKVFANTTDAGSSNLKFDHVIVTTKAIPSIDLPSLLTPVVSSNSMIHLIQNGIGIEDGVANSFPNNPVTSTVAMFAVSQYEPGKFKQTKIKTLIIGLFKKSDVHVAKLNEFIQLASENGLDLIGPEQNIQIRRWHKLLWNGTFNPISIIEGCKTTDLLLSDPRIRETIRSTMEEIKWTAEQILKVPFPNTLMSIDKYLEVTEDLKDYKPSMLIDWENGREMELDVLLVNPIRIAKQHGYEMPKLQSISDKLMELIASK